MPRDGAPRGAKEGRNESRIIVSKAVRLAAAWREARTSTANRREQPRRLACRTALAGESVRRAPSAAVEAI
eukprot:3282176-Prymnesium_polylepis.1